MKHRKENAMQKCYPDYIITSDGYIGKFCRLEHQEFPVYRFPGGERIADNYEIETGSDSKEELIKRRTQ